MPRVFTWQGSGHFLFIQITRIIGRQLFKFKFWTDDELRSEGSSVDLEQRLWIDKKISRIIFKPHSEVGLVSWTSLFKTFFNQGLILEPSSLTIVVHSTVGFIVLVTDIGDMNIGDKIYILSPWYSHENGPPVDSRTFSTWRILTEIDLISKKCLFKSTTVVYKLQKK